MRMRSWNLQRHMIAYVMTAILNNWHMSKKSKTQFQRSSSKWKVIKVAERRISLHPKNNQRLDVGVGPLLIMFCILRQVNGKKKAKTAQQNYLKCAHESKTMKIPQIICICVMKIPPNYLHMCNTTTRYDNENIDNENKSENVILRWYCYMSSVRACSISSDQRSAIRSCMYMYKRCRKPWKRPKMIYSSAVCNDIHAIYIFMYIPKKHWPCPRRVLVYM